MPAPVISSAIPRDPTLRWFETCNRLHHEPDPVALAASVSGAGLVSRTIDLKRNKHPLSRIGVWVSFAYSVAAGTTATFKAWHQHLLAKHLNVTHNRGGVDQNVKKHQGFHLGRFNAMDRGYAVPMMGGTTNQNNLMTVGPGVWSSGILLYIEFPVPRMAPHFAYQSLYPAARMNSSLLEVIFEQWGNLFVSGAANTTLLSMSLRVDSYNNPYISPLSDFALFSETRVTQARIQTTTGGEQVYELPIGNFYRGVAVFAYEQSTALANDFLFDDIALRESNSEFRKENWQRLRMLNLHENNIGPTGFPMNEGMAMFDFGKLGDPHNLLDTTGFDRARKLDLVGNIPTAPPVLNYVDIFPRIVIPQENRVA